MKKPTLLIFSLLTSIPLFAQQGTIRGTVVEEATGEPLIGVNVVIKGTANGGTTDFDGHFFIKTDPGTYDIRASFVSFNPVTINGVVLGPGKATHIGTIRLGENIEELEGVVVTAEVIRTTESALLTVKKKSANMIDGISSETFRRIGDSDAAGAIKRVTGVSVQDDSYVYVRGLGDRYTKTILNNLEIPGLDPDRNALQIDIFPTNVIDNMVVYKTFTPDLSADFVGGTVNIETKDFPEEKTFSASVSVGYNAEMHLNKGFLTYEGGSTDFLGIDDGTRDLPYDAQTNGDLPLVHGNSPADELDQVVGATRSLSPILGATTRTNPLNFGLNFSGGNQIEKEKLTLGYNYALGYSKSTKYYENAWDATYQRSNNSDEFMMQPVQTFTGPYAESDALFSGLIGGAIKSGRTKYSLKILRIQNGTGTSVERLRVRGQENINNSILDNLEYTERFLTNINGEVTHYFNDANSEINVNLSSTWAVANDKDVRITPFTINDDDGSFSINASEGGEPNRIWRLLDEQNHVAKIDYSKKFSFRGNDSKLRTGMSNIYKTRDYIIHDFFIRLRPPLVNDLNGDPNQVLSNENILDPNTVQGTYVQSRFVDNNTYQGTINNVAAYIMGEMGITSKLRAIIGLRAEKYRQLYTGRDTESLSGVPGVGRVFEDDEVLESLEFFPSFHLRWSPNEESNIRAVYSRTVARPSFKEKSTAEIQDVKTGTTFLGNIDLIETNINNYDLRYEYFLPGGQTYSASAFYKAFTNPIELVRRPSDATNYGAQNVGDGSIIGAEIEVRKSLAFVSPTLSNFLVGANITWTTSEIDRTEDEILGEENGARDGEVIEPTRDFVGQSPLILNISLHYDNFEKGWEGSLAFNRQGPALYNVGINFSPDIYTVPFNSLHLKVVKRWGVDQNNALSLKVDNLLGDWKEREWHSFNSPSFLETSRDPGRTISVGFSKNF